MPMMFQPGDAIIAQNERTKRGRRTPVIRHALESAFCSDPISCEYIHVSHLRGNLPAGGLRSDEGVTLRVKRKSNQNPLDHSQNFKEVAGGPNASYEGHSGVGRNIPRPSQYRTGAATIYLCFFTICR
jgi:hypothetical protein